MLNIFLCLPKFFFFDLLDSEWETENCHEESGLGYSQMGVTTKFLYLCVKLHPKLSVPKKKPKPKTIHKQIWSRVWGGKTKQPNMCCASLSLCVVLCFSAGGALNFKILPEQCRPVKIICKDPTLTLFLLHFQIQHKHWYEKLLRTTDL